MLNLGLDNASGSGNDNIDSISVTNYATGGRRSYYKQKKKNYLTDVFLFYTKELKNIKSKVDVLIGRSYQDFYTNVFNFPSLSYRALADPNKPAKKDTIEGTEPTFLTDKPQYRLESYIGRVNFTLANKYLLTASIRRDASSKFSPDTRVGYFPAVAVAWKLKDEFFINTNAVSELKLRLGWGITGQQDGISYYPYLPRYAQSTNTAQYQFGNTFYSFLRPAAYDSKIKWETTTTSNIALDFGFLNNRISGSVDVYKKKTKDLLSVIPVAPGSNFDITLLTNVGNMENSGVEFTINTTPVKTNDITWDFGFNYTYNKSEITNLLKQPDPNFKGIDVGNISGGTGNIIGKFAVGYAPYSYFVYKQVYDKSTNKPIDGLYEDVNRDGAIDDADRYLYKSPSPDVLLGINTQLVYKQFSIGLAGHGAFGQYLYNNFASGRGALRNIKDPQFFLQNAAASYRETGFSNNRYLSDYYISNASYFRLDNINLGYNFGKVWQNKASLRVAASIQNVFVITKYSGLDPENANNTGIDNIIYPRPRVYSLGVNLDF
jgi:iron complex outermembrane receptor protein